MTNIGEKKSGMEYRMYGIALRQLTGIDAGIQFQHAVTEYAQEHFKNEDYQDWAKNHKTSIVLQSTSQGIEAYSKWLKDIGVEVVEFREPDLYNQVTCIAFLLHEKQFKGPSIGDLKDHKEDYGNWSVLAEELKKLSLHGGK